MGEAQISVCACDGPGRYSLGSRSRSLSDMRRLGIIKSGDLFERWIGVQQGCVGLGMTRVTGESPQGVPL